MPFREANLIVVGSSPFLQITCSYQIISLQVINAMLYKWIDELRLATQVFAACCTYIWQHRLLGSTETTQR